MSFDRRLFLAGAGAAFGLSRDGSAQVRPVDGHSPITREQLFAMARVPDAARFTCVETTEETEGPFYTESSPERRAIAEQNRGAPLRLGITVGAIGLGGRCTPLPGAVIDIWHSNAAGLYSNVRGDVQSLDTVGQTFLRGHQRTDDTGHVEFDTIVPGWELIAVPEPVKVFKRTTHIHLKAFYGGRVLTAQLYFPDPLLDQLYADVEPYRSHRRLGAPGVTGLHDRIRNGDDGLFNHASARPMTVERVNGVLTAQAMIGMLPNRPVANFFR